MQTLAANVKVTNPNPATAGVAANDIYLDNEGNIALSLDLQAVLEACAEAAQTILGEMVLNTDQGIPYKETIWQGVPNITQFTSALRTAFLAVGGGGFVVEVISLTTSQTDDQLNYTAIIRTIYGSGGISA